MILEQLDGIAYSLDTNSFHHLLYVILSFLVVKIFLILTNYTISARCSVSTDPIFFKCTTLNILSISPPYVGHNVFHIPGSYKNINRAEWHKF